MLEVYSLEREPNSLEFIIHPDPDQMTIFDYVGEEIDYEAIRIDTDELCAPYLPTIRDTGVPIGFRHWRRATLDEYVAYYICRAASAIKEAWLTLWK